MIKKLLLSLFLAVNLATSGLAQVQVTQDVLPDTTSADSTAILNNNLRQNQNAINTIGAYFGTNGALQVSAGGTGGSTFTGILYGNGQNPFTTIALSADATQFLNGNGAFSTPVYPTHFQLFTASGTFTAPTNVTVVYLTGCGAGGGGGSSNSNTTGASGGGSAGKCFVNRPYTVTGGNNYTVTIGAGGASNTVGGDTVFDALTFTGGNPGSQNVGLPFLFSAGVAGSGLQTGNGATGASSVGGGGGGSIFGDGGTGNNSTPGGDAPANSSGGGGGCRNGTGVGGTGGSGLLLIAY